MALDEPNKRASAINVGSPWRGILPFPDGSVDDEDRPVTAFMYSGVDASIDTESGGLGEAPMLFAPGPSLHHNRPSLAPTGPGRPGGSRPRLQPSGPTPRRYPR